MTATENSGSLEATVPFSDRFVRRVSARFSSEDRGRAASAGSASAMPNKCTSAIAWTSVFAAPPGLAIGNPAGTETASPAAGPGTSIQITFASCHAMAITSSRLIQGGRVRFSADSDRRPSASEKSAQFALLIMTVPTNP